MLQKLLAEILVGAKDFAKQEIVRKCQSLIGLSFSIARFLHLFPFLSLLAKCEVFPIVIFFSTII